MSQKLLSVLDLILNTIVVRLVSDRGNCFTSREFEEFLNNQNVQHIKVMPRSCHRLVPSKRSGRKIYRTILPMIAKLASERNTPWYNVIRDVEFACNNTVSKSTNECPSKLLFGILQRGDTIDALRLKLATRRK